MPAHLLRRPVANEVARSGWAENEASVARFNAGLLRSDPIARPTGAAVRRVSFFAGMTARSLKAMISASRRVGDHNTMIKALGERYGVDTRIRPGARG
jgi:hypothetical protein